MKRIFLFFIIFVLLFLSNSVLAVEGGETAKADFSNASFKIINTNNNGQFYSLEVSNITLPTKSNGKPVDMNVRYTIGNTEPEFSSKYGESYDGTYNLETKKLTFARLETALQLKGDVYFWIYQLDDTEAGKPITGKLVHSAKIERPADKKYAELFETKLIGSTLTNISLNTPMENFLKRKAQFKIGEITDKSILAAIKKNNQADGFDKLLNYAKNSSTIYDGILEGSPTFVANLHDDLLGKVKNDTYYYVYTKFDDENGKYHPVEGITIGLGVAIPDSCDINFYGSNRFNWDNFTEPEPEPTGTSTPEEPDNPDTTKKPTENNKNDDKTTAQKPIPQAGELDIIIGLVAIVGLAVMLYFLNKKYNFIK